VDGDRQSHSVSQNWQKRKEKKRKEKVTGCFATLAFSFPRAPLLLRDSPL
jgi:hypothetical protein